MAAASGGPRGHAGMPTRTSDVRPPRSAAAAAFGTYPSRSAAASTRARVAGETRSCSPRLRLPPLESTTRVAALHTVPRLLRASPRTERLLSATRRGRIGYPHAPEDPRAGPRDPGATRAGPAARARDRPAAPPPGRSRQLRGRAPHAVPDRPGTVGGGLEHAGVRRFAE